MEQVGHVPIITLIWSLIAAVGVTATSVSLLFHVMGSSYSKIIVSQQTQITQLRGELETERITCEQRIRRLSERLESQQDQINALKGGK
jgi:hypothetical protein